jgi:hypothetical protein
VCIEQENARWAQGDFFSRKLLKFELFEILKRKVCVGVNLQEGKAQKGQRFYNADETQRNQARKRKSRRSRPSRHKNHLSQKAKKDQEEENNYHWIRQRTRSGPSESTSSHIEERTRDYI